MTVFGNTDINRTLANVKLDIMKNTRSHNYSISEQLLHVHEKRTINL